MGKISPKEIARNRKAAKPAPEPISKASVKPEVGMSAASGGFIFGKVTKTDCDVIIPNWQEHGSLLEATFVIHYLRSGDKRNSVNSVYKDMRTKPNPEVLCLKPGVQKMLGIASRTIVGAKFNELRIRVTSMLWERAFYDPALFYNPDGSPAFHSWDEIPPHLRCVVDGIETKAYGKEAERITTLKMADRMQALKMMAELAQSGALISGDEAVKKLEHDDLALLFDEGAKTFQEANKRLLGMSDPEDEDEVPNTIQPYDMEMREKLAGEVNPDPKAVEVRADPTRPNDETPPVTVATKEPGAPQPKPKKEDPHEKALAARLPTAEELKKVSELAKAKDLEGL